MAGVALGDMDFDFAWQPWHLRHWAGSVDALGPHVMPCVAAGFFLCGGRGLGDMDLDFEWQTWHLRP